MADPLSAYVHRSFLVDPSGVQSEGVNKVAMYSWDSGSLQWVRFTGTSGGGGGAATIADGADVAEGATTDSAVVGDAAGTVSAKLRGLSKILNSAWNSTAGSLSTQSKTPLSASSPSTATLGVSSGTVIAANSSRKGLVIVNVSANTMSFGIGATAVLSSGITLYPGGSWEMDEYTFSTSVINGIASSASSVASVQEFS